MKRPSPEPFISHVRVPPLREQKEDLKEGEAIPAPLNPRWLLALLVLACVALRLWLMAVSPLDPRFSNADDGDYYQRALRLAVTGQYVDDAWLIRPPLHVFFFALWLRLALLLGQPQLGVVLVQLAQTALAALTVLLGHAAARRLFASERAGLLFAAFLALWYPFVESATVLFSELTYLFLFLLHLWLLLRFDTTGRLRDLALAGVALGAAALTRSPALYALVFVVGWLGLRQIKDYRLKIPDLTSPTRQHGATANNLQSSTFNLQLVGLQALVVAAACLAVVGPWTLRNYLTYGRLIPVDTLGQVNLWLDLDRVSDRSANIETLRRMPQADRHVYALERAREILAEDPWRPFRPMWSTFRHIWKAQYIEDYYVKQSFFTRPLREMAPLGLAGDALWLVAMVAGLWGLAGPAREGLHNRLFFLAWLGYSLLTVLIFHVEPRYLLPLWMLIALYGAGALASPHRTRNDKRRTTDDERRTVAQRSARWSLVVGRWSLVVGFLALLLTYRDYPAIIAAGVARERAMAEGERQYIARNYAAAEESFRQALAAQPGFVDAQVSLALALAAQGRQEEAAAVLTRNSSRRTELVFGAIARDSGDLETARALLTRIEAIAGEDVQRWALRWLHPPATNALTLGDGLDLGYIEGFSAAERDATGTFRWLEGAGRVSLPLAEPLPPGAWLELRLTGGRPGVIPLEVQVGDGPARTVPVAGGAWRIYRVPLPPTLAGQERVDVTLRAPTFVPVVEDPTSTDARALSLMVASISVR
ncbi:MAG TPA: glycosyltransferase family 39 protein [Roseiflexaceae bacterium]|nr:glycosyltransferase family 39 protein [Roseiflexaceae bacterium]